MFCVVLVAFLALVNSAAVEKRFIQSMDQTSLKSFTKDFRSSLLDKIATEWNVTVGMTNSMKVKMAKCNVTIKAQTIACDACANSTCTGKPNTVKNVSLPDPMTHMVAPMKHFISRFSDVDKLVGVKGAFFCKSMKFSAETWFSGMAGMASFMASNMALMGSMAYNMMKGFFGIFGKRTVTDSATLACMQTCPSCPPLMLSKPEMISQLCGADIGNMNKTIDERVKKMEAVYDAVLDAAHPILTKVEYETSSGGHVFVSVRLNGLDTRYQSTVPYHFYQMEQSADQMALEYWNKFNP